MYSVWRTEIVDLYGESVITKSVSVLVQGIN